MARLHGKDRGLFERPKGSGVWWTRIFDSGREIRTKVGSKSAANVYYKKQKTRQMEGKLFSEKVTMPETFIFCKRGKSYWR